MSRAIHATTPSGDEVTLEANAQLAARERTATQVEHNAMQALGLVRATVAALAGVAAPLERLALLLAHSRSTTVTTLAPELQRVITQLGETIHAAALRDEPLLTGGGATFAVEDPSDPSSSPLRIELPDLSDAYSELAELDLMDSSHATLTLKQVRLTSAVQAAQKQLAATSKQLGSVLASRRPPRAATTLPRVEDDGFIAMIQAVRASVLHAGDAALRVQGSPSARAAWLIEARRDAQ